MECDYCGDEARKTQGKLLVLNSGDKKFFCSGSCEKNWKNKRKHTHRKQE
ncbi:hypothetical protein [Candidatus Nanohalococcus occultus]|uniref:50S ribosomal protein L24e n=1 Tax=Candidatus Nanohalococcus occultus TaxID=2978047 RepID=A0ABY8CHZ9_9ARCH|nr:Ribosomal protein L24E [Candidatus Nanohaloarchaeota archaeon SVXNc]